MSHRVKEGEMADEALFIGWGEVVTGRARRSIEVFNEAIRYYAGLQEQGKIDGLDAWLLAPHGGDLNGFLLVRGERDQLDEIQRSREFERLLTQGGMVLHGLGVVNAYTGEALARLMHDFEEAAAQLEP
jgi:hypothetical protein